mgnify:CR=1 FL=1
MQIPHADDDLVCPLHKAPTETVCHKCPLSIQVRGKNPNTGEDADKWACSLSWLPLLMIENSMMQRQTGAAVESFRNEMVQANNAALQLASVKTKLIEG